MYTILAVFFFLQCQNEKPLIDHYTIRLNHVYESSNQKRNKTKTIE